MSAGGCLPPGPVGWVDSPTRNGQHNYAYNHDQVGNRTTMTVTDSGPVRVTDYSYDNIYRITGEN